VDGKTLFYLKRVEGSNQAELWKLELDSGKREPVLPGYAVESGADNQNYSVSADGKRVVFAKRDEKGLSHLCVAGTDHQMAPVGLPAAVNEDSPAFLPDGRVVYRATEGGKNYLSVQNADGTGKRRLSEQAIVGLTSVSANGRWAAATESDTRNRERSFRSVVFPIAGGEPVVICQMVFCTARFGSNGKFMDLELHDLGQRRILPLRKDTGLPDMPKGGFTPETGAKELVKGVLVKSLVDSVVSPEKYSYTKENIRRNIFRVPIG